MSNPRTTLLVTLADLMSSYFLDECPPDTNWEDFSPEIDGLRSEIHALLEVRSGHPTSAGRAPAR